LSLSTVARRREPDLPCSARRGLLVRFDRPAGYRDAQALGVFDHVDNQVGAELSQVDDDHRGFQSGADHAVELLDLSAVKKRRAPKATNGHLDGIFMFRQEEEAVRVVAWAWVGWCLIGNSTDAQGGEVVLRKDEGRQRRASRSTSEVPVV
jgi:hypothetical protein